MQMEKSRHLQYEARAPLSCVKMTRMNIVNTALSPRKEIDTAKSTAAKFV
jgi:hypothetical protein